MRRPSFFLSSTIYDFRDLRSALKYFLEQQGCAVLASEYNDFPKPLDTHSYEACLSALQSADYFVLLIGKRVGGWFDVTARVSITQQEYREAYKLHEQGKLKLISFVRADIWRMREDRKELADYLNTLDIDPAVKQGIANHPSKRASDANFICDFISEVCRNKETKAALKDKSPMPTGNWVHVFETFRDVADVIQTQAFSGIPIEQAAIRRLLLRELEEILCACLVKFKEGQVYSPKIQTELFHKEHRLTIDARETSHIQVNVKRWDNLSSLSIHLFGVRKFNTQILQRALESSAFLTFNSASGTIKESPAYEALWLLQDEIRLLNLANNDDTRTLAIKHTPRTRPAHAATVSIEALKLLAFLHLMDRWVNVVELAKSIIIYLRGDSFFKPQLRPRSPIPDMNDQLEEERMSPDDLEAFIRGE